MALNSSTGFVSRILGPASFESIFDGGAIDIYTGTQPANGDAAVTGTLIGRISADGGAWAVGGASGLTFTRAGRAVSKLASQSWVLAGLGTGQAGWWRLRTKNADAGGFSTDAPRIDGAIGLDGAAGDFQMILPFLDITPATSIVIPSFYYLIPPL